MRQRLLLQLLHLLCSSLPHPHLPPLQTLTQTCKRLSPFSFALQSLVRPPPPTHHDPAFRSSFAAAAALLLAFVVLRFASKDKQD